MSKAVTVAEITKRRLRQLHQNTQIGINKDHSGKRAPMISVMLSLEPLDPSESGCAPVLVTVKSLASRHLSEASHSPAAAAIKRH